MENDRTTGAAHLAVERIQRGVQPSIFDLLSQESLMNSLNPAFHHILKYLSTNYPERFGTVYRFYDEIYSGFDLLLQNYCLRVYGASFSENFYGMKRIVLKTGQLPTDFADRLRSLIFLVAVPYLRRKLDLLYEELVVKINASNDSTVTIKNRLAKAFVRTYPWLKSVMDFWTFFLQFFYLISRSDIHSPLLKMAGVRLESLNVHDLTSRLGTEVKYAPSSSPGDNSLIGRLLHSLLALPSTIFRAFSKSLGFALFFVQFLDYWYDNSNNNNNNNNNRVEDRNLSKYFKFDSLPIPPAPHNLLNERQIQMIEPRRCPICRKVRKNDTVLSVSGYVFCYGCIKAYIDKEGKCPVTKMPASTRNLIRIFTQNR